MSNERKHAELIKRWAENKDLKVYFKNSNGYWVYTNTPFWEDTAEYRLVEPGTYKHFSRLLEDESN